MGLTNKAKSTKFLNIIIRTNHEQRKIVMLYGDLKSSETCVTTSCSNDSSAYRRIEPINRWDVVPLVQKCVTQLLYFFLVDADDC